MSTRNDIITGIKTQLELVATNSSYPIEVKTVSNFEINLLTADINDLPIIVIVDTGSEITVALDNTNEKFKSNITFVGAVKPSIVGNLQEDTNNLKAFIKQFIALKGTIAESPNIHANCKRLTSKESEVIWYSPDESATGKNIGIVVTPAMLRYFTPVGSY